MNSRSLLNLVLLVVVLGLVLLVYLQEQESAVEADALTLTGIDASAVDEVRLMRKDSDELLFRRVNDRWMMEMPERVAANGLRVEQLLSWLAAGSTNRYGMEGLELSRYGLDKPFAHLIVGENMLAFGARDPLQNRRYVSVGGYIHLVAEGNSGVLTESWRSFVSPRLLPDGGRVVSITVPGLGVILRQENGWHYEGEMPPVSSDDMQALVDRWSNAQAVAVEDAPQLASDDELVVKFDNSEALTLRVVRDEENTLLVSSQVNVAYRLSAGQVHSLFGWAQ